MRIECKYDELMPLVEVEKRWHPDNENSHPEEQIRSLAKVIGKIGIRHAIHISKQSGKIAGGHGRYLAFKKLGYDSVPIVWENFKDEVEELNYRASDNLGQYAEFNNQEYVLNLEKAGLDLKEIDLEEFGVIDFEIPEIEVLDPQTDEDEVPDVEHPITRRGDIWLLGKHRLMCGDSTMIDDVEKLMNGEKADMVFTDPPYGVSIKGKYTGTIKNDNLRDEELEEFLSENNNCLRAYCNKAIYVCYEILNSVEFFNAYSKPDEVIIWNKDSASFYSDNKWNRKFEAIMYFANDTKPNVKGENNVWDFPKSSSFNNKDENGLRFNQKGNSCIAHPTTKPFLLPMKAIEASSKKGDVVLDTFTGSGSTLIAAEKSDRIFRGMELDEKYCDVIISRWQNYTGKKATLESTGQTYEELKAERL